MVSKIFESISLENKVLKEKIAVFFMNNLEYIIHGGRLKALLTDENKTELVRSASLMSFAECINKYNPYNEKGETIPFMAYFYKTTLFLQEIQTLIDTHIHLPYKKSAWPEPRTEKCSTSVRKNTFRVLCGEVIISHTVEKIKCF